MQRAAADLRSDLERLTRGSDSALTDRDRLVAAGAGAIALAAVGYSLYPRQANLTDKDRLVRAECTNTTGDPGFDETLRQGLAVQLQPSRPNARSRVVRRAGCGGASELPRSET